MNYYENRGGFLSQIPTAVKHIMGINILVLIMCFIREDFMYETFSLFFPVSPFFKPWQLVTYMFMHGDFFHLFFNMYTLFIFGSVLERVWGTKKFLLFYFVTGIGAGLVHMGVQWYQYSSIVSSVDLSTQEVSVIASEMLARGHGMIPSGLDWPALQSVLFTPTVGASGSIYGILLGYAMLYPDSILRLIFPPVALKAKWFVLIFAGIELLLGVTGTQAGVAHFAHLGGLVFAFALIMYWKKTRRLYSRFD